MTVAWQPLDLPLGQGLDANTNRAALPPGKLRAASNCHFARLGGIAKRTAFDILLGTVNASARLAAYGDRLIARAAGVLSEAVPPNTSIGSSGIFVERGTCRSVPTRALVAKSSTDDIASCDAFSAGNMTITAWLDGGAINAQIIDESTGAVVSTHTYSAAAFGGITPTAGFQLAGDPGGGSGMFFWLTFSGYLSVISSNPAGLWTWGAPVQRLAPPGGESWIQSRIAVDHTNAQLRMAMISSGGTHLGAARISFAGTLSASSSHAVSSLDTACPISAVWFTSYTAWVIGYRTTGGSLSFDFHDANTMVYGSITVTQAADQFQHLTMVENGGQIYAFYDVLADAGTYRSKIFTVELDSGGINSGPDVVLRGLSLASDAIVHTDGNIYMEGVYHSEVSATLASSVVAGSLKPDGTALTQAEINALTIPTINGGTFVLDYNGNVCARVLRDSALMQTNTASASKTSTGFLFASRAISQAESGTVAQALQLGAVALVRFDILSELPRGVTAAKQALAVGGCPTGYDGNIPSELGFNTYPEIPVIRAAQTDGTFSGQVSGLWNQRNTTYALGTVADQEGLDPTAGLTKTYNGNLWLCVAAGKTAGSIPAGYYGGVLGTLVVDGTSTWQCLGLRLPQTYASGIAVSVGHMFVPSTGYAGFICIVAATDNNGSRTTATEPAWPLSGGGSVTIAASPAGTITYVRINVSAVGLTPSESYTYGTVFSSVDDQGQLHRSTLSPTAGITINAPPIPGVLIASTTARLSRKSNVRVEVYRTDGNGTVLEQINTLASSTQVDLVGLLDVTTDTAEQIGGLVYQGSLGASGLPNQPPPSCSAMAIYGRRVWCNSLESTNTLYPSQLIVEGYGVAWADELAIQIDAQGGDIRALQEMDGTLIIFQENRISFLAGDGPDNTGAGDPFFPPQVIAADVGCTNPDSVLLCPAGIVFQGNRGIYLLDRSRTLKFIGEPMQLTITNTIVSAAIDPTIQQIILVDSAGGVFIYDYGSDAWGTWTIKFSSSNTAKSIVQWQSKLVASDSGGNVVEQSGTSYTDVGGAYLISCTLAPTRLAGAVAGFARARAANIRFEYGGSAPTMQVQVLEDYSDSVAYTLPTIALSGTIDSIEAKFRNQRLTAIALAIAETVSAGGALIIEGITFEVGVQRGLTRRPPSTKRIG